MKPSFFVAIGILAVVALLLISSPFIVFQTEQALVLRLGKAERTISEPGLYFKIPLIDEVIRYERRVLPVDIPAEEVLLGDQKRIEVDTFTRYRIDNPEKFFERFQQGGSFSPEAVAGQRLRDIISSSMRQVLGTKTLAALLSEERVKIMREILDLVNKEASEKGYGLRVLDVRIRRADLPPQNSESVFERMRSQRITEAKEARAQGGEAAQRIVADANRQRVELVAAAQRDAQILRGQGEGEAIAILADAYGRDPEFFEFYRSLNAYRTSFANGATSMVLSPDHPFFRYFSPSFEGAIPGNGQR